MTTCNGCHEVLGDHNWSASKKRDGSRQCKSCHARKALEWRRANPERVREISRRYRQKNPIDKFPERKMLNAAKARAKRIEVPFDIDVEDIKIPEACPVFGIPLYRGTGSGNWSDNSPTLDRIIPSRGYVKGNVVVISLRANRIKNDATLEELKSLTAWMETQALSKT